MSLRLKDLAQCCDAELVGDQNREIKGVANLRGAKTNQLSLFSDKRYIKDVQRSEAAAILTNKLLANEISGNKLVVDNPLLALAQILKKFDDLKTDVSPIGGICPSATIADSAQIGAEVTIAAHAVIGEDVVLGAGVKVGAGSVIYRDVTVGQSTVIDANVTLYQACEIGERCHISAGTVIGADGFGFAESRTKNEKQWVAIAQIGKVVIGNDVHIGANTAIDRGSLDDTVIADDVIIDNLVQIAHNVKIGQHTAIAGCAAIAGSTEIGRNCKIGGRASIVGHLKLCDDVTVLASSLVTKSITKAGAYSASMPAMPAQKWRKVLAKFRHNIRN